MIGEPLPRYGTVYDLVRDVPIGLLTLDPASTSEEPDLFAWRDGRLEPIFQNAAGVQTIEHFRRLICPGGVMRTTWRVRTKIGNPKTSSKSFTCLLRDGWARKSFSAARVIVAASATAAMYFKCLERVS
jgi:hypothetical protein